MASDPLSELNSDEQVPERVVEVFRRLFPHYTGPVYRRLTATQVPGWDSLTHAELIMSVEEVYGVLIDPASAFDYADLGALLDDIRRSSM